MIAVKGIGAYQRICEKLLENFNGGIFTSWKNFCAIYGIKIGSENISS